MDNAERKRRSGLPGYTDDIHGNTDRDVTGAKLPTHVWAISETGLLKSVNLAKRIATNFYDGAQPTKSDALTKICSPTATSITGVTERGVVKKFEDGHFTELYDSRTTTPIFIEELESKAKTQLTCVHAYKSGEIFVNQRRLVNAINANQPQAYLACGFTSNEGGQDHFITVGGKDMLPTTVNIRTGKITWAARNVAHNWLALKVPVFEKDLKVDYENPQNCFYSVTAHGFVRKYDRRAGKKSTHQTSVTELGAIPDTDENFISICQSEVDTHLIGVGGNRGSSLLLDSRMFPNLKDVEDLKPKKGRNGKSVVRRFRPAEGALNSIGLYEACGETPALMGSCGADRKLRIYERDTGALSHMIYLKSRINQMMFVPGADFVYESSRVADPSTVKRAAEAETPEAEVKREAKQRRKDKWDASQEELGKSLFGRDGIQKFGDNAAFRVNSYT